MLTEHEVSLYGSNGPRFGDRVIDPEMIKVLDVDSLIGSNIEGTSYFETIEGDETNAGCFKVGDRTVYLTKHTPTNSEVSYRKVFAGFKENQVIVRKAVWEVDTN